MEPLGTAKREDSFVVLLRRMRPKNSLNVPLQATRYMYKCVHNLNLLHWNPPRLLKEPTFDDDKQRTFLHAVRHTWRKSRL